MSSAKTISLCFCLTLDLLINICLYGNDQKSNLRGIDNAFSDQQTISQRSIVHDEVLHVVVVCTSFLKVHTLSSRIPFALPIFLRRLIATGSGSSEVHSTSLVSMWVSPDASSHSSTGLNCCAYKCHMLKWGQLSKYRRSLLVCTASSHRKLCTLQCD